MTISKFSFSVLAAAALVIVPLFAIAQTPSTGLLTVHVQVINQSGMSYTPSNFTVNVTGQNPTPSTFQGSQSGTVVSLGAGAFKATLTGNLYGFTPSYSIGCDNTIAAGGTHSCIITLSGYNTYPYPSYPSYSYPYPIQPQPLTCVSAYQTVPIGQTATFRAQGGVGGTYNWFANGRTYANVGPTFNTIIESTGQHLVTVTNGAQTATCSVTVTASSISYYPNYPVYPGYQPTYPTYTQPTYSATYYSYPRYPNTGFEPQSAMGVAFAAVLLIAAAIALTPYVRKSFALAVR